jgi:hypothetical protein
VPTARFEIGQAFPATDPVARFVAVVAMMGNDWHRLWDMLNEVEDWHIDSEGKRLMLLRIQVAYFHEASVRLRKSRDRYTAIDQFIAGMPAKGRRAFEHVTALTTEGKPRYLPWLADDRNVYFHYPELKAPQVAQGGYEEVAEMLKAASSLMSTITSGETVGTTRFEFADELLVQRFPERQTRSRLKALRGAAEALVVFIHITVETYLNTLPQGTVTYEP